MTIKEALLKVMSEMVFDEPVRQTDIVKRVAEITNYSYESCRCNTFRNPNAVPEIFNLYKKVIHSNRVCYIRQKSEYKHNYHKPDDYYMCLHVLNNSDSIYTLSGTNSNCMSVLDYEKTTLVDLSVHANPKSIRKNIFNIKKIGSYNLDFEGLLTKKKIDYINSLCADHVLLTFRSTKNDYLVNNIKMKKLYNFEYKSGKNTMKCYLFSNLYSSIGDFSNK